MTIVAHRQAPLLAVHGLKKHFPILQGLLRRQVGVIKAVDNIDFEIQTGEILGIVGESGSGKSTAARAAIRLIEPTAGTIFYEGHDLSILGKKALRAWRRHVQMVFQDPNSSLNPRKTIGESIGEALLYHAIVKTPAERDITVAAVLGQVGLDAGAMHRYPHAFSGGQQQRICIGRAIALAPKLIILDEAVSSLDVSVQAQILTLLKQLKNDLNLSYLFIAHDLATVRHFCDAVLVLYLGQVMEKAPTDALFARPHHPYTQALLAAVPRDHPGEKRHRLPLHGEIPSAANPPSGCPFRTRCPYAQKECQETVPWRQAGPDHFYRCILPPQHKGDYRI